MRERFATHWQIKQGEEFGVNLSGFSQWEAKLILRGKYANKFREEGLLQGAKVDYLNGHRTGVISRVFIKNLNASVEWEKPIISCSGKEIKKTVVDLRSLRKID